MTYYVTMTDEFMSGWGMAQGKTNKLVFECSSYEQAEIVAENAKNRGDQKYINICSNKPYYNKSRYYAQYFTEDGELYRKWYTKNGFSENN